MSTKIYEDNRMNVTSFYGGVKKGRCLQIGIVDKYTSYVECTESDVKHLSKILDDWLNKKY